MSNVHGFLKVLAGEVGDWAEEIVSLPAAAEKLFERVNQAKYGGRSTPAEIEAVTQQAMEEIERETRGMPFRVDLEDGPLFVFLPLWRFAGAGGPEMGDGPDNPEWGHDWKPEPEDGEDAEPQRVVA